VTRDVPRIESQATCASRPSKETFNSPKLGGIRSRMIQKARTSLLSYLGFLAGNPTRAFVLVLSLSCAVRLSVLAVYALHGNRLYTGEADNIARSLVTKGAFADPFALPTGVTAHCPPIYPLIGAAVYGVFGLGLPGEIARCVANILAFSLLYALLPWIGLRFGLDFRAGLLAGLFAALVPTTRSAEILLGWETPYAAIVVAFLLAWTRMLWRANRIGPFPALLWGVAWGAASLLQTALFAVFAALCGVFLLARCRLRSGTLVMLALLGCSLALIPWAVRNRATLGAWMFVRSNLGIELEVGNHDGARPDTDQNVSSRLHPFSNPALAKEVRELGEVEYNRRALRRATSWIRGNPIAFLRLTGERCFRFWFSSPAHPIEFAITCPLMIASLWGMMVLRKKSSDVLILWFTALIAFSLIYCVTQYSARYRAVVEWVWLLAAGQFCLDWMLSKTAASAPVHSVPNRGSGIPQFRADALAGSRSARLTDRQDAAAPDAVGVSH
jgi:hypothetical protein